MRATGVEATEVFTTGILTFHDRCDRCGSQAYVAVSLQTGRLLFCAHHYREYEVRLRSVATSVCDERERLDATS
jgi:ribosomal protein L37E